LTKDIKKKEKGIADVTTSLHSNEIKKNLDSVNMDPWYHIYENYVNPTAKKKM
jgi:hypothetical protein